VTRVTRATKVTFSLLAKGMIVVHHRFMNHFDDVDLGTRLLPGVDLTLWLQIIAGVLLLLVIGGIALTLV
jgi:hypothetical protein